VSNSQRFAFHGLGTAFSNLLLATLFCGFAYAHLQRFLAQPRPGMGQFCPYSSQLNGMPFIGHCRKPA
jgi:hypothetical protein